MPPLLKIYSHSEITPQLRRKLISRESALDEKAFDVARNIIHDVETRGEEAVLEYTEKFDGARLTSLMVSEEEFAMSRNLLSSELKGAFEKAAHNIRTFHQLQRNALENRSTSIAGTKIGYRYIPVDYAAAYVPGGKASYPSSVLMGIIPAIIAGVEQPLIITPPDRNGKILPAVLFAAELAGTRRILKAGGAQGIAAAAFGLAGSPAQVVVGPGNRFVTAAKSLLTSRGILRMDMPAGPSEVIIIADKTANPLYIASDLLSQAEHGEDSPAILLTDSEELARATAEEVEKGIQDRPSRKEMKSESIRHHSYAIVFSSIADCVSFSNEYGPEHLEICTANPERELETITSGGSVFMGHYAPVALGDYFSGTNHVLPTGGAARFYSGLGVDVFLKRITWQHPTRESLEAAKEEILLMSKAEGLDQEHGHSVAVRFEA